MRTSFWRQTFRLGYSFTFTLLLVETYLRSTARTGPSLWCVLIMVGLYLMNYGLRNLVIHVWPILLLNILAGVGMWLIPLEEGESFLLTGIAIGLMLTSTHYVRTGGILTEHQDIPWPTFILGLLAVVASFVYDIDKLPWIAAILSGVEVVFFLLIHYADNASNYLNSTKDVKGIPVRQIVKLNSMILGGIFLCMLVGIFLAESLNLTDALVRLTESIGGVFKGLFFGAVLLFRWIGNLFGADNSNQVQDMSERLRKEVSTNETFPNLLEIILKGALIALTIYILVRLIYRLVRILSGKYQRRSTEKVVETRRKDTREKMEHTSAIQRMREYFTPREKARRIYRKKILEFWKDGAPAGTETTADLDRLLQGRRDFLPGPDGICQKDLADLTELTELYNRVRYGNVVPDREYLSRMKQALKNTAKAE